MEGQLVYGNSTTSGYATTCLLSLPSLTLGLQMEIHLLFPFSFFFLFLSFLSFLQETFGCCILHNDFSNYTELKAQASGENVKRKHGAPTVFVQPQLDKDKNTL